MISKEEKSQIILCAYHDFAARYLIYSGIMKNLLLDESIEILLLTDQKIKELILDEKFDNNDRVKFFIINKEEIDITHKKFIQNWSSIVMNFVLNINYDIYTVKISQNKAYQDAKKKNSILSLIKYFLMFSLPVFFLRRSALLRNFFRNLILAIGKYNFHPEIYKNNNPKLLIVNSIGFKTDTYLIREAKKNNVKCISAVMNWDNTTTKGMSGCKPDRAIAWNNIMKEELINHHDLNEKNIFVGGVPHYSSYSKDNNFMKRSDFYKKFELQKNKKIVLFGSMSPTRFETNAEIIEMIAKANNDGLFIDKIQIIVRLHPIYFSNKYFFDRDGDAFQKLINKYKNLYFCDPIFRKSLNGENALHPRDSILLANLIKHSDIVICYFSTLMLEASLLDKPVINMFIEGMRKFFDNEEDVLKEIHLKKILSSGAVSIANTRQELIKIINSYLQFPKMHSKERLLVKKTFVGEKSNLSPERISKYILNQF